MSAPPAVALHLGIDTGGTHTDAVLLDPAAGVVASAKALTTPLDLAQGIEAALEGLPSPLPGTIELVSFSTTLATNALVEGRTGPAGLLLIGLPPQALTRAGLQAALGGDPVAFIAGGHRADGSELEPLDLDAARAAIVAQAPRVGAFAISGQFAVRNPAHERRVRELALELSGLPATCGHELSARLDAPRRALTALLNARLIARLRALILAVRGSLAARGIEAPLMVVKGDGALMAADDALLRPVETILSGPAASVVGGRYLAGLPSAVVVDMGGTTTDIALLDDGLPRLDREGARVGGFRSMVEAIAVHTVGLGGDSEVHEGGDGELALGPARLVPLALLGHQWPATLAALRAQADGRAGEHDGRFALGPGTGARRLDGAASPGEAEVLRRLADGPAALAELIGRERLGPPLSRLVRRSRVLLAGFTPSDAAHVLGLQTGWSTEAAALGALLLQRGLARRFATDEDLARAVMTRVAELAGEAILESLMVPPIERPDGGDGAGLGRRLLRQALSPAVAAASPEIEVTVRLRRPLIALGAPAGLHFPGLAASLGAQLVLPEHAAVANAVGAVAGGVVERAVVTVTAPAEDRFRVHAASGPRDFGEVEAALAFAAEVALAAAGARARRAGAERIETRVQREVRTATLAGGRPLFVEATITAIAAGRPRRATG